MKCFNCQDDGHVASQCPQLAPPADPAGRDAPWCGYCEPRTRQLHSADGRLTHCPECHPLRSQMLAQHKRCPYCHKVTVAWDTATDCEHHILAATDRPYVPVEHAAPSRLLSEDELRDMAKQQVSESRAARHVIDPLPADIPGAISGDISRTPRQ